MEEIMATGAMRRLFEQAIEQGLEQGLEQGREQGLEQGREQGELQARQRDVLHILERRFGAVPADVVTRIEQTADTARLIALLDAAAVDAPTLEAFSAILDQGNVAP
jgi:flagellar biosynthesis/type III secretory pathway protein FliH